ncbi:MAG TPA: histidinol-phosphatase [Gaiellaceae bacterium]
MIVDYHVHLRGPSEGREGPVDHTPGAIEPYVETAVARGVDEVGFTEHLYYFREFEPLVEHPYQRERIGHDLDTYVDAVVEAKRRGLPVKLGLEVDWFQGRAEELAERLAPYPWDYLLGSVHIVDGEAIDLDPGLWGELTVEDVWRRYFEELEALARSGLVDVMAHPDLVKIFGLRPSGDEVESHHADAVEAMVDGGVAFEVSTAGLRKPVAELYPAPALLEGFADRGLVATLASDAHVSQNVGLDLDRAVELLRRAGYETVTVFEGRQARQEPLG